MQKEWIETTTTTTTTRERKARRKGRRGKGRRAAFSWTRRETKTTSSRCGFLSFAVHLFHPPRSRDERAYTRAEKRKNSEGNPNSKKIRTREKRERRYVPRTTMMCARKSIAKKNCSHVTSFFYHNTNSVKSSGFLPAKYPTVFARFDNSRQRVSRLASFGVASVEKFGVQRPVRVRL